MEVAATGECTVLSGPIELGASFSCNAGKFAPSPYPSWTATSTVMLASGSTCSTTTFKTSPSNVFVPVPTCAAGVNGAVCQPDGSAGICLNGAVVATLSSSKSCAPLPPSVQAYLPVTNGPYLSQNLCPVTTPTAAPTPPPAQAARVSMKLNINPSSFNAVAKDKFITAVANNLNISKSLIQITAVRSGSTVVDFTILPSPNAPSNSPTPLQLADVLVVQTTSSASPLVADLSAQGLTVEGTASSDPINQCPDGSFVSPCPTSAPTTAPVANDNKSKTDVIVGVVVGVLGALLIGGLVYYMCFHKKPEQHVTLTDIAHHSGDSELPAVVSDSHRLVNRQ